MAKKYIESDTFEFQGVEVSVMFYQEGGFYYATITHVIQEPNGNLYEPGGATSMDTDLEHLKHKMTKTYLSNFYEGCKMVINNRF